MSESNNGMGNWDIASRTFDALVEVSGRRKAVRDILNDPRRSGSELVGIALDEVIDTFTEDEQDSIFFSREWTNEEFRALALSHVDRVGR